MKGVMVGKGIPGLAGGNQGLACETIDGYWIPGAILWWKVVLRGTSRRVFLFCAFCSGILCQHSTEGCMISGWVCRNIQYYLSKVESVGPNIEPFIKILSSGLVWGDTRTRNENTRIRWMDDVLVPRPIYFGVCVYGKSDGCALVICCLLFIFFFLSVLFND